MPSSLPRVVRRSVRGVQNIVGQIVVSVAAAVCVAFITNAYVEQKPGPEQSAANSAPTGEPASSADKATIRLIAAPTGSSIGAPARPLAIRAASPSTDFAEAPASVAETPAGGSLPPLASEVISDLPVREAGAEGAEIFPGVPVESALAESLRAPLPAAEPKRERRHFLGLPLPYVPGASELLGSASAAGGKIVSIVEHGQS